MASPTISNRTFGDVTDIVAGYAPQDLDTAVRVWLTPLTETCASGLIRKVVEDKLPLRSQHIRGR